VLVTFSTGRGAQPASHNKQITFSDIAEIIPSSCNWCHGWDKDAKPVGYFMDNYQGLMDGAYRDGKFTTEIIPGDAQNSPFVQHIDGRRTPRMPYHREPLSQDTIDLIRAWIDQGARPDSRTTLEHEIRMDHVPVTAEKNYFWLSCRAPRNEQNMSLRVKVRDEITGKVVAYDWPISERDLNGRWSQWKIEVPLHSMQFPGSVTVSLFVADFWPTHSNFDTDDPLNGVIFLLDNHQTEDQELLIQKDLKSVPQPEPPPHQKVKFQYILRVRSDIDLFVYPESDTRAVYHFADKDVRPKQVENVIWSFKADPKIASGWYVARLKCTSRVAGEFQPGEAILFQIRGSGH